MRLPGLLIILSLVALRATATAPGADDVLATIDRSPHTEQVANSNAQVVDHEVGLGAIRKVRGVWEFKRSARYSGRLARYTWQVKDGFESAEVLQGLAEKLLALEGARQLFECTGRACGHANQWANRVFGQRLLYGKSDEQHYRVIAVDGGAEEALVLLYSSARTADRQYLHADYLVLDGE